MKLYDFDGMFDEKLKNYIAKNPDKYSESGWENVIPEMYKRFGDTKIKSLDKTPREFYAEMTADELVKCLKAHLKQGVPRFAVFVRRYRKRRRNRKAFAAFERNRR